MKPLISLCTCLLAASMMLSACDPLLDCEQGSGEVLSEKRNVAGFTMLEVVGDIDLVLTQGEVYDVRIEAQETLLNNILTRVVEDGKLRISTGRCYSTSHQIVAYVTLPSLTSLKTDGACSTRATSAISATNLMVNLKGSGDINLDVSADTIYLFTVGSGDLNVNARVNHLQMHSDGSGNANVTGTTIDQLINISASGNFNGFDFASDSTYVYSSGSGDCHVNVRNFLKARLSGSGNLVYHGNPDTDIQATGSGTVTGN